MHYEIYSRMITFIRYTAYNMWVLWKNYNLFDWIKLLLGALIFIAGFVLGTISWRKGSSVFFVLLHFLTGLAGFFYFCVKGLKIFSDASEGLFELDHHKEHPHLHVNDRNKMTEEDYVYDHSIISSEHETRLEESNASHDIFQKDIFQDKTKYLQFFPYKHEVEENAREEDENTKQIYAEIDFGRENAINSFHYENAGNYLGSHVQRIDKINREGNMSSDPVYINTPIQKIQIEQHEELEIGSCSTLSENEMVRTQYLSNQSLNDRKSNEQTYKSYQENNSESFQFSDSYKSDSTMRSSGFISFPDTPLRNSNSISQQHLSSSHEHFLFPNKEQRNIQSSISEYMLSAIQRDGMQHYQVPRSRSLSFDNLCAEDHAPPDPLRHLKPAKGMRKLLPPLPISQNSNYSEESSYSTPLSRHIPSRVSATISPSAVLTARYFQTPSPATRPFQHHHKLVRDYDSLAKQLPHNLILDKRLPSSLVRKLEPLERLFSHPLNLETRISTNGVQSPPPRPRLIPPYRTKVNMSMQNLKRSPPSIPRKNRSFL